MGTFPVLWKMAWRNVWRQRRRSLSTFIMLSAGLVLAVSTYGLARGITRQLVGSVVGLRMGHLQVHAAESALEPPLSAVFPFPDLPVGEYGDVQGSVSGRIHTAGMLTMGRPVAARLRPFPETVTLTGGRLPERRCDVLVDDLHREDIGRTLLHPAATRCPLLNITGSIRTVEPGTEEHRLLFSRELDTTEFESPTNGKDLPLLDDPDALDRMEVLSGDVPMADSPGMTGEATVDADRELTFTLQLQVPARIFGVDPVAERRFRLAASVIQGRWLPAEEDPEQDLPVCIGTLAARRLDVQAGDRIGLDIFDARGLPRDAWGTVTGIFSTGIQEMDSQAAFIPVSFAWDHLGFRDPDGRPLLHELAVMLDRPRDLKPAMSRICEELPGDLFCRSWKTLSPGMDSAVAFQEGMVFMILSIVILMAMLGTLNSFLMSILERTREFGVLKAVGFSPGSLFLMILLEAAVVGAAAVACGLALGGLLNWHLATSGLDLRFIVPEGFTFAGVLIQPVWKAEMDLPTFLVPALWLWGTALMAAIWPAWRVARMRAVSALTKEA